MADFGIVRLAELSWALYELSFFVFPLILLAKGHGRPCWMMAAGALVQLTFSLEFYYHSYIAQDYFEWLESPKPFWGLWLVLQVGSQVLFAAGFVRLVKNWLNLVPARECH